jgi:hypothetical protein
VRCTEKPPGVRRGRRHGPWMASMLVGMLSLASCTAREPVREPLASPSRSLPADTAPRAPVARVTVPPVAPPAPAVASDWTQYRVQAAHQLVAANPNGSYLGATPEVLLAIPVLQVELNRDGSVKRIVVLRHPRQAKDTTQLAINAVRRAAPFGDVSRLPRPWRFTETFLFDDARRFKPRSLD